MSDMDIDRHLRAKIADLTSECQGLRADFERECLDTDTVLRALGFEPKNCRTDGGSLVMPALLGAVERRAVMAGTAASQAWVMVPRVPTDAMVEAICAAVAQADWPNAYFEPAQQRRRRDARLAWLEAVAAAPTKDDQRDTQNVGVLLDAQRPLEECPTGKCTDPARDCFGSGCLGPNDLAKRARPEKDHDERKD